MKRPFELVAEIQNKDAEIERLKAERDEEWQRNQDEIGRLNGEIRKLETLWFSEHYQMRKLLTRAADALEKYGLSDDQKDLIAKLRKAARMRMPIAAPRLQSWRVSGFLRVNTAGQRQTRPKESLPLAGTEC